MKRTRGPPKAPGKVSDQSYKIDTTSAQFAMCTQCMLEVPLPELRRHMAKYCPCAVITCPMVGCGCTFQQSELKRHLARECPAVKARAALELKAEQRKKEIAEKAYAANAPMAKAPRVDSSREAELRAQLHKQYLGGGEGGHDEDGEYDGEYDEEEEDPDVVAAREAEANGQVLCPDCREPMRPSHMSHHRSTDCIRRLIMCPNRYLGCEADVPLCDVMSHLRTACPVEKMKEEMLVRCKIRQERIVCVGCGDKVALKDFRKHENEYCSNRYVPCRNAALGCQVMVRMKERAKHEFVDGSFKVRPCLYMSGGDTHISIAEDDVPAPWTAEYWVYLPSAAEAVKRHIVGILTRRRKFRKYFVDERRQNLRVMDLTEKMASLSVTTGAQTKAEREASMQLRLQTMDEISSMVHTYEDVAMQTITASLQLNVSMNAALSLLSELMPNEPMVTAALPSRPPGVAEEIAAAEQRERTRQIEEARLKRIAQLEAMAKEREEAERKKKEAAEAGSGRSSAVNSQATSRAGSAPSTARRGSNASGGGSVGSAGSLGSAGSGGIGSVPGSARRLSRAGSASSLVREGGETLEVVAMSSELATELGAALDATGAPLSGDSRKSRRGSVMGSRQGSFSRSGSPAPIMELDETGAIAAAGDGAAVDGAVVEGGAADGETALTSTEIGQGEGEGAEDKPEEGDKEEELPPALTAEEEAELEAARLRELAYSCPELSVDPYFDTITPRKWKEWLDYILVIRANLERDLEVLLQWRIASGLIEKPKKHEVEDDAVTSDDGGSPGKKGAAKKAKKKSAAEIAKEKAKAKKEKERKRREERAKKQKMTSKGTAEEEDTGSKFREKLANAIKTIHGCDVMCSSSNSPDRICLNIYNETAQNGTYNITSNNLMKFPGVHHLTPLPESGKYPPGKVGVVTENGPHVFEASLPRQQWIHVGFVCVKKPKKRLTFYVDGVAAGIAKDIVFPLPLDAIGCSDPGTNDSFHGCFMDVRYWRAPRSANEMSKGLHSLINIVKPEKPSLRNARSGSRGRSRGGSRGRPRSAATDDEDEEEPVRPKTGGSSGGGGDRSRPSSPLPGADGSPVAAARASADAEDRAKTPKTPKKGKTSVDMTSKTMIGWWTFEDGNSNLVTDVTEQRFRRPIVSSTARMNTGQHMAVSGTLTFHWIINPNPHAAKLADAEAAEGEGEKEESAELAAGLPAVAAATDVIPPTPPATAPAGLTEGVPDSRPATGVVSGNEEATGDDCIIPRVYSHVWMDADYGVPLSRSALRLALKESSSWDFNKVGGTAGLPTRTPAEGGAIPQATYSLLPLPSFRARQVCPFELRRFRLALKGRALMKELDCIQGCGLKIRKTDMRFHVAFECQHREMMCRFAPICRERFMVCEQAEHEADVELCEMQIARQKVLKRAMKGNFEVPCSHCGEAIRSRDLKQHENEECIYRHEPCPREDCGEMVQVRHMKEHMKFECSSKIYRHRCWMIRRGRQRKNYPRPWGIEIPLDDSGSEGGGSDSELELNHSYSHASRPGSPGSPGSPGGASSSSSRNASRAASPTGQSMGSPVGFKSPPSPTGSPGSSSRI